MDSGRQEKNIAIQPGEITSGFFSSSIVFSWGGGNAALADRPGWWIHQPAKNADTLFSAPESTGTLMYELFFKQMAEKIALTPEQQDIIKQYLIPKKIRKNQYLLQEGDVAKHAAFVEKGALRAYSVDDRGTEHIIQFAFEGWTISDLYSFLTGEAATYNVDALEDSELVLISKAAQDEILKQIPEYEVYTRLQITGAYLAMQKRLTSMLSLSLEERYINLTKLYPNLIQRVPQRMIASYMGLTPETLSRVRRKIKDK